MSLDEVVVYHLALPLRRPYVLSFGAVDHFNSFVALATGSDGTQVIGETTPLPGYSHETTALIATELKRLAEDGSLSSFLKRNADHPFVTAPILTCLESEPIAHVAGVVELCPILQCQDPEEIGERVAELAAARARVLKVKIGPELDGALEVVRQTVRAGRACGVRFRYDANQSLQPRSAERILKALDPATTELLEQPLPVDAWPAMRALHSWSPVPLMLDESIVDDRSITAAATCADLVKLKLAKNGSPTRLLRLIEHARRLGLGVILGNGAQGTVGCILEAKVQLAAGLDRAGEMNGFRKLRSDPLGFLVADRNGALAVPRLLPFSEIRRRLEEVSQDVLRVQNIEPLKCAS
jgi:L-alanine-DL-glutamate epimerase-like enolase superfamily enzyme